MSTDNWEEAGRKWIEENLTEIFQYREPDKVELVRPEEPYGFRFTYKDGTTAFMDCTAEFLHRCANECRESLLDE